jgi:two-component system, NtrC family, sensor histidine kinase HydH
MDILGQSALLVALTSFALGFSILARDVRNKLFLSFAVMTTMISAWAMTFFLDELGERGIFYRYHLLLNIWLGPAVLGFIRVLVRIHADALSARLRDATFVLAISLTGAVLAGSDDADWIRQLIYFAPAPVVLQILQLMVIDWRLRRGSRRKPKPPTVGVGRRTWIYLGGLLVLSTSVLDHVPWLPVAVPAIGNLLLTAYLFLISQAISRQRLLNLGALLTRFLVTLAVALTLTVVYSLLVGWIENSPGLFFLNSFITSFLILMLLEPLRRLVSFATERLLTQKYRRLQQSLREAQRRLAGVVELGTLFGEILSSSHQLLEAEASSIFILRPDGTKFRRARSLGSPAPVSSLKEILSDHPLLQACDAKRRKGELPILVDQILESEIDRSASRAQREGLLGLIAGLRALDANLLIPLISEEAILGFVTLRSSGPPEPWGSNWGLLTELYPYYEQSAQTLRSMEVFARAREKERLAELGEMAAGLAHEIRNPLGAIRGAAQFLDPSSDRPDARFLRVIIEEADRLNRVVTQFLDYSKPAPAELKRVDLSRVVEKTLEVMRATAPAGIRLELQAPRAAWVDAAPEQIQQIMVNLIQNSFRALDGRAEPRVRVSVEVDELGREAAASVEDNGAGIRREHLDKLFIPFFTTHPSGTGLGLSISQKIVEAHRGRMEVATEEGRFARFSVILPLAAEGNP